MAVAREIHSPEVIQEPAVLGRRRARLGRASRALLAERAPGRQVLEALRAPEGPGERRVPPGIALMVVRRMLAARW